MPMQDEKRYTASEFYACFTEKPCELINGYVADMSPSPNIIHQHISGEVFFAIKDHIRKNKGKCRVFEAPTDVQLNDDTVVVPDIFVACKPENFDECKYNGAPDWVIEIVSKSTSERDYKDKLLLYKKCGVREYWIIDPMDEKVIVYTFGSTNFTEFYNFSDSITPEIYKDNAEKLSICIEKLLEQGI
jgi:Uma2 family endonuclease